MNATAIEIARILLMNEIEFLKAERAAADVTRQSSQSAAAHKQPTRNAQADGILPAAAVLRQPSAGGE